MNQEVTLTTLSIVSLEDIDAVSVVQTLVNQLFDLAQSKTEDGVFAIIPAAPSPLPRFKPIPVEKHKTRWEKFAALKGIKQVKKKRVVFDEQTEEYRPTYGYKNQGKDTKDLTNWIVEVGEKEDQTADLFKKQRDEKKERVSKNEMQQRRNGQESRGEQKATLRSKITLAKQATASMGRFDTLDDKVKIKQGKRKVELLGRAAEIKIAEDIGSGKMKVSTMKAIKTATHPSKRRK